MNRASYIGVVRLQDQVVLASVFAGNVVSSQKATLERFLLETVQQRQGKLGEHFCERITINVLPGDLRLYVKNDLVFAGWIHQGASESSVSEILQAAAKICTESTKLNGTVGSLGLQSELKKPFRKLMSDFGDESKRSKLDVTQDKVNQATSMMQVNMRQMMENQKDLEALEESSANMGRTASLYQTNAKALRVNTDKRLLRLRLMVALGAVLVILYFIYLVS